MLKKLLRKQDGLALPIVIVLFTVIMVLSISALNMAINQSRMTTEYTASVDALHIAESGINEYMWYLNKADHENFEIGQDIEVVFADESVQDGMYRLEYVDGSVDDGYVRIRSTGYNTQKPDKLRTIEAVVSKKSFTEYVWLTNAEEQVWNVCIHTWNGPFHTNHTINISGQPKFYGPVTYSNSINTSNWYAPADPQYFDGDPRKVESIDFPDTNSELISRAKINGHYYDGMTAIFLNGDTYDVKTYNRTEGKWYFNGQEYHGNEKPTDIPSLPLPDNGVIYVDGSGTTKWHRNTGDLFISGEIDGQLTVAGANNIYITGYDPTDWREPNYTGDNPEYVPQGEVTGGISYARGIDDETSLFGLIAENNIEIINRRWPRVTGSAANNRWGNIGDIAPNNINLHGAYMALRGTIKYDQIGKQKGDASLFGSMIQDTRGAFASGNYGYGRDFYYDPRLLYQIPPYFLEPVDAGWELNEWREVGTHVPPPAE